MSKNDEDKTHDNSGILNAHHNEKSDDVLTQAEDNGFDDGG